MTRRIDQGQMLKQADIVASPPLLACVDQSFEMPTAIFATMGTLFFGFLAVMTIGFANPNLAVPMAVNFAFLTAFFGIPVLFVRIPQGGSRALGWSRFMRQGIQTATGHSSGTEAAVLTLLLPLLIFLWAVAITIIAALI
ncbi:hypothetical protein [Sphingomonas alba]|uniref:Uncharacterized protein n=1 Tax=Sphingomonas alba TaxID=2908208 RepID=A0ABT0RNJ2_9SPHN|nr:hypothetical protein [Sphingomonas alba]MCL6684140.1 hypothetical protein [Sphingomonas alba]